MCRYTALYGKSIACVTFFNYPAMQAAALHLQRGRSANSGDTDRTITCPPTRQAQQKEASVVAVLSSKDSLGLENGCPQAELMAIRVPASLSLYQRVFHKHKIEVNIQNWDKMAIIKGWLLDWVGCYAGFHCNIFWWRNSPAMAVKRGNINWWRSSSEGMQLLN